MKRGIESPPETWSGFLEVVQKLKDAGITPIAIGEGEQWLGMFWYTSLLAQTASPEEILAASDRSGAFNSPGYVAAGQTLEELIALEPFQEGFLGIGYADAETLMANNRAAMPLMGHTGPMALPQPRSPRMWLLTFNIRCYMFSRISNFFHRRFLSFYVNLIQNF